MAFEFVEPIFGVLGGSTIGYLAATISESLLHRFVGHASGRARHRWKSIPFFSETLTATHFGHAIVHHGKTFRKNHVTQFCSSCEIRELDDELTAAGRSEFIDLGYGLTTNLTSSIWFFLPPITFCLVFCWLLFGRPTPWFFVPAAAPSIFFTPALSRVVHPYLHLRAKEANHKAGRFVAWLLSTSYGRWLTAAHFVHHRDPKFNFNLLPGGDYLLGTYRDPTAKEREEMKWIGLIDVRL